MDKKALKIVFMGTSDFGIPVLNMLNDKKYNLISVVTLSDRIAGRGKKSIPVPVKKKALELNLPILETDSLKDEDFKNNLKSLNPDIFIVIAFRILPDDIINIAKHGAINLHASLLPKYRGPAPINHAIINGENKSGITVFKIDSNIDTGNIIIQKEVEIAQNWDVGDLYRSLSNIGPDAIENALEKLCEKNPVFYKQDDCLATKAPKLFKQDALINWNDSSNDVKNKILGTNPIPGAFTYFRAKMLKIKKIDISSDTKNYPKSGKIVEICSHGIRVSCKQGSIILKSVAPEGKKEMEISSFINGYKPQLGELLIK